MRSAARLAAWMPATRATASTSPLLTALLATRASASGFMNPRLTATTRRRLAPLPHRLQRVHRRDGVHDLVTGHHLLRPPRPVGVERHELDEPDLDPPLPPEGGELDDLVVVHAPHEHAVDLDPLEPGVH